MLMKTDQILSQVDYQAFLEARWQAGTQGFIIQMMGKMRQVWRQVTLKCKDSSK